MEDNKSTIKREKKEGKTFVPYHVTYTITDQMREREKENKSIQLVPSMRCAESDDN